MQPEFLGFEQLIRTDYALKGDYWHLQFSSLIYYVIISSYLSMFLQSVCFATFNFLYVIITILIFNSDSTTSFTNFSKIIENVSDPMAM